MKKAMIAGAVAIVLLAVALVFVRLASEQSFPSVPAITAPAGTTTHPPSDRYEGFLYGRITTTGGEAYEGRLRWGGDEEAFWNDYFDATKSGNPWASHRPSSESKGNLDRPFMRPFGEIARIDASGGFLVTLKNGTVIDLDRFGADDLADGVRVWDSGHGPVDLEETRIRTIEFLSNEIPGDAPYRLQGTVRTSQGDFGGFIQWNREACVGHDTLAADSDGGALGLRFDTIRSIEKISDDSVLVTLLDDREIALTGAREVGQGNRGIFVSDVRYGRVLVSWDSFERVDFSSGGSGPAYDDFPPAHPLEGSVTTRGGTRFAGRIVYDLDESGTTDTLDASIEGVSYAIPFGRIASIVPADHGQRGDRPAGVTLHDGGELKLGHNGDLGDQNLGVLVFVDGAERPEYVSWIDVERIDFNETAHGEPGSIQRSSADERSE